MNISDTSAVPTAKVKNVAAGFYSYYTSDAFVEKPDGIGAALENWSLICKKFVIGTTTSEKNKGVCRLILRGAIKNG